jgi:hypothetical protein
MFVNSIDTKPFFTRSDGETIRDLSQTMFEMKNRTYIAYNVYKIPAEYAMRPDLISKAVYNNSVYAEIILKFNGISNPFSINAGDIILIPNLESARENVKIQGGGTDSNVAAKIRNSYKYIDPIKIPKKSSTLKQFDQRNLKEGSLPPNITEEGTSQITYRNGRVYFNGNNEACLKNGMSSSEFLTKVIKNKQI